MLIPKLLVGYIIGIAIGGILAAGIVLTATVHPDFAWIILSFTIVLFAIGMFLSDEGR